MLSVGISGGMGSGKSLICQIFNLLGIPIYNSDYHAKRIMEDDEMVRTEIIRLLGPESYFADDILNKKYIANKIFNDTILLTKLNQIVHPAVKRDAEYWKNYLPENQPYFIRESAILFETGIYKQLDYNILVTAPESIRIKRIQKRDGLSSEEIKARLDQQWTEEKKIPLSDFQIVNDGELFLLPQVLKIHQILKKYSLMQAGKQQDIVP
ncbi:MAG: hypothetical protein RLZZ417_2675 [Bacteroidota bacterium]|jgi:dephospho-CoA kinase